MITKVNIDLLKEAEYNARIKLEPEDEEYQDIKRSLEDFGYVEPIVWNKRTGNIVGGHQRVQVLKELGETEIEVSVVDLPLKDEKQLSLALNRIKGKWDYDKLKDVLRSLDGMDLSRTGFHPDEIAVLLEEDDIGEMDWDDDWGFEPVSESWVVILKFPNYESANNWAEEHGYEGQCKKGTKTTVIRVDNE